MVAGMTNTGIPSSQLPSYEDLQAERSLKESVAQLLKDHEEIQHLFKSVAAQLRSTPNVGKDHDLSSEWGQLSQKYWELYRESQLNASQCSNFLSDYGRVLVPTSQGSMSTYEKKFMINQFIKTIPVHQEAARKNSAKFHELSEQVEAFPTVVSNYLREEAEKGGLWARFYARMEEFCTSIWNALHYLLNTMISLFRKMLSQVARIQFTYNVSVCVDIKFPSKTCPVSESSEVKTPMQTTERDSKRINDKLVGFESAWHIIWLASTNLLRNVELAEAAMDIPSAADGYLNVAGTAYQSLVHCLRAYSQGKSPLN